MTFENVVAKGEIAHDENIVKKEEIAQNEQFLLLPQCFPLLVIGYTCTFNYREFLFFDKICLKSSAAEFSYEGKGLSIHFPACRYSCM